MRLIGYKNKDFVMPCMGPDCDAAREEGARAYDKVMQLLANEYHIDPKLWYMIHKGQKEQHTKIQLDLKTAIEEMFIHDACATF